MILGTAGHIDHGKTALVRALTGIDTDRLPEEKRRGITIDLGFAPLTLDGVGTIGIVDVPGHEAFVRTMLAGASGIDVALLVVAADEGIMPQTREHLEILSLLKIPRGVVALTKCDLVEPDWIELVTEEIGVLVEGTPLAGAEVVPVSTISGEGIGELKSAIARAALQSGRPLRDEDLFRMPVDRAFTVRGTGTVVTGTVWSGEVRRDMTLIIQPAGRKSRVRAIQSHGTAVDAASPGHRAAIALMDCDVSDVGRGSVLVTEPAWAPTREMDASLSFMDAGFSPSPRTRVRIHLGTSDTGARFGGLRAAESGEVLARVILDDPVLARGGDRFVIRLPSPARTIGGGQVLDPYPLPGRQRLASMRHSEPSGRSKYDGAGNGLAKMLELSGATGIALDVIPIRTGLAPSAVHSMLAELDAEVAAARAWCSGTITQIESAVEMAIAVGMANHPLEAGVSLQTIRSSVTAPAEVMELALNRLAERRRIELVGSLARPFGWVSQLGEREQALSDAILHEICIHPAEPPSVGELSAKFGGSAPAMLRRLEREGQLERVSDDRFYSRDAVAGMIEKMRATLEAGRIYAPAELRDVLGVSRKYLIPFLEFCDRKGITERRDEGRVVRGAVS